MKNNVLSFMAIDRSGANNQAIVPLNNQWILVERVRTSDLGEPMVAKVVTFDKSHLKISIILIYKRLNL